MCGFFKLAGKTNFTDEKELAYNISNDKKKVIEYFRTREDDGSGF